MIHVSPYYDILIERDFSALFSGMRKLGSCRRLCIVTDSNVGPLYLEDVKEIAKECFALCTDFVFPAGEENKNTSTVERLYERLIQYGFDRKDLILALGGGVVGDLAGFAAATYLRGIDFVQVPTSLLAQVDSSIGGKTGVDFLRYKNMVGAFHMPRLVYANLATLLTLPDRQFASGMAEVIKHGLIKDNQYLSFLEKERDKILAKDLGALEHMVAISCEIKRGVVERDPKEQGERALLNFGHTIGHAIETLSDFSLAHGECVALGMVAASRLSRQPGKLSKEQLSTIEKLIASYQLPIRLENHELSAEDILGATKKDKKMDSGRIREILLERPGEAYLSSLVSDKQLLEAIEYLYEK